MVDMAKKVNKKSELLDAGENAVAAVVLMKKGQFKKTVTIGAIGGVVGHLAAAKMGKSDDDVEEGSMADAFPQLHQAIFAVTNQRWVFFEHSTMSGGPKSVITSWPHEQITAVSGEKSKLTVAVTITFADGSSVDVETPKANKPMAFVETAQQYCGGR